MAGSYTDRRVRVPSREMEVLTSNVFFPQVVHASMLTPSWTSTATPPFSTIGLKTAGVRSMSKVGMFEPYSLHRCCVTNVNGVVSSLAWFRAVTRMCGHTAGECSASTCLVLEVGDVCRASRGNLKNYTQIPIGRFRTW